MNKATGGKDQEGNDYYWIWFVWSKKGKESDLVLRNDWWH